MNVQSITHLMVLLKRDCLVIQESVVDFQEIEEALMLVKQRKEQANQDLDFLNKVDNIKGQGQ